MNLKKIFILFISYSTLFLYCAPVTINEPDRVRAIGTLNIRSGPSINYDIITTVSKGTELLLLRAKNDWYEVKTPNGKSGWVFKAFTQPTNYDKIVITKQTYIRRGPGINYDAFAVLIKGKTFNMRKERGNWYLIDLPDGNSGWVSKSDAQIVTRINLKTTINTVVREMPNENSRGMMHINKGTELIQLDKKGAWYLVRITEGTEGWIHQRAVKPVSEKDIVVPIEANIRRGPDIKYEIIETVKANTRLTELERKGDWIKVRSPSGSIGWVFQRVVKTVSPPAQTVIEKYAVAPEYITTNQDCNIRQGYSTEFKILTRVKKGTILLKIGERDNWFRIKFPPNSRIGWIRNDLVENDKKIFITNQSCNIRQGYSTNFQVIRRVAAGTPLAKIGSRGDWYRIYLPDGVIGWIRNDLTIPLNQVLITNQDCNVRQGPGTNWKKIDRLKAGTIVRKLRQEGDWYRVRQANNKICWIRRDLVVTAFDQLETDDQANIREAAGTNHRLVKRLPSRARLYKIGTQGNWLEVRMLMGGKGWIREDLVTTTYSSISTPVSSYYQPSAATLMTITETNIRIGPGFNYAILIRVKPGTELIELSQQGDWYKVKLPDGNVGYVHRSVFSEIEQPQISKKLYTKKKSHVRKGPDSTKFAIVATLAPATAVSKLDQRENWTYVKMNDGRKGWIYSPLLSTKKASLAAVSLKAEYGTLKTIKRANIYSNPSSTSKIINIIPSDTRLSKFGRYKDWYQILLKDNRVGWVSGNVVEDLAISTMITVETTSVKKLPQVQSQTIDKLPVGTILTPNSIYNDWYSITTATGKAGWINEIKVKPLKYPKIFASENARVKRMPYLNAAVIKILEEGAEMQPSAERDGWYFVQLSDGQKGWISKNVVTKQNYPRIRITKKSQAYKKPSIKSQVIAILLKDEKYYPADKQGEWCKIFLRGGDFGWVYSSYYEEITSGNLLVKVLSNIREGPGYDYKIITTVAKGTELKCYSKKDSWRQVLTKQGEMGWIKADLTKDISFTPVITVKQTPVRSGPSEKFAILQTFPANKEFTPIDQSDSWYQLKLSDTKKGWVLKADCIKKTKSRIVFTLDLCNIRNGPGLNYEIIRRVDPATDLMVIGETGDWYNVKLTSKNGITGWIKKDLVFE